MIFVTTGSRDYQFNRLLKEVDVLAARGLISNVFAQIGASDYEPKYCAWQRFLDKDIFDEVQDKADLIISHGGTGALIGALKKGKKVIAVPRLVKFGEHIDNHQEQITSLLSAEGYLLEVSDITKLYDVILQISSDFTLKRFNLPSNVLKIIQDYLSYDTMKQV